MDSLVVDYDKDAKIWSGPTVEPLYNLESHSVGKVLYGQMKLHPKKVIQVYIFESACF